MSNGVVVPNNGALVVDGLGKLADLLSVFVVPEECSAEDLTGGVHKFRPVLSARRVLSATVLVTKLLNSPQAAETRTQVEEVAKVQGRAAALATLLTLAPDEDAVVDGIERLFATVQPDLLGAARVNAAKADLKGIDGKLATNPLDLFEVDQVVAALLPFSGRVASRVAALLRGAATAPVAATTA